MQGSQGAQEDSSSTKNLTSDIYQTHQDPSPPLPQGSSKRSRRGQFLPPIVFPPPSSLHKSTVIFLHGRGSNAQKFSGPLLSTQVTDHGSFRDALPCTKFIFPTAPLMRATKYRRSVIHQWYDGTGDWEPEARGNMKHSVEYIHGLLQQETHLLGAAGKVVLAGISQGCAMALMSMLLWDGPPLGAVVGICGFMPLNAYLTSILNSQGDDNAQEKDDDDIIVFESDDEQCRSDEPLSPLQKAVAELREEVELAPRPPASSPLSFLSTPIFIGHGTEDKEVEYCHGKQTASLLGSMGLDTEFRTYHGLGHWYSEEMMEHIVQFMTDRALLDRTT